MAITGKKISWVKQHLAVALKANPKIIEMLSPELPEYKRLTFSAVYALSMVPDRQRQLEVAETAVTLGWTVAKIRRVIEGERVKSGRRRKPSDEFSVFEGFIHRTNRYLEDFCVHHPELLGRMFTFRPPQDSRKVCEAINSIMAHFNKMKGIISLKIEQQEERD